MRGERVLVTGGAGFIGMADEFNFPKEKVLQDLEHIKIKKRKGDEGYSDDVVILKEIFERKI